MPLMAMAAFEEGSVKVTVLATVGLLSAVCG